MASHGSVSITGGSVKTSTSNGSLAIASGFTNGDGITASDGSITIGIGDASSDKCGFSFGNRTTASNTAFAAGYMSTAKDSAVAVGNSNTGERSAIAVGERNNASDNSVALGYSNTSSMASDTIGANNYAEKAAIAVGMYNSSFNGYGVLVGWNNQQPLNGPFVTYGHGILLGSGNTHYGPSATNYFGYTGTKFEVPQNRFGGNSVLCNETRARWQGMSLDMYKNEIRKVFPAMQLVDVSDTDYENIDRWFYVRRTDSSEWCVYEGEYSFIPTAADINAFAARYFTSMHVNIMDHDDWEDDYNDGLFTSTYPISWLPIPSNPEYAGETMSFLAGTQNTSIGNNNVAIGHRNYVGSYNAEDYGDPYNNGFATAIGYDCKALRNYDFAMGYKSTAEGGENIAINQSTAKGYNNLAMFSSDIYGIRNVGIHDSILHGTVDKHVVVYNQLRNSKVEIDGGPHVSPDDSSNTFTGNSINFASVAVNPPSGVENYNNHWRNNVFTGTTVFDTRASGSTPHVTIGAEYSVVENNISGLGSDGNQLYTPFGTYSIQGYLSAAHVCTLDRNIMHNSHVVTESCGYLNDNVFRNASIDIPSAYYVCRNKVYESRIVSDDPNPQHDDTRLWVDDNLMLLASTIDIKRSATDRPTMRVLRNILLNNASLTVDNTRAFWNGSVPENLEDNVLISTTAHQSIACFSFGQIKSYDPEGSDSPVLDNCHSVYNFGDNTVYSAADILVSGEHNNLHGIAHGCVVGSQNTVLQSDDSEYSRDYEYYLTNGGIHELYLFGVGNTMRIQPDHISASTRNTIFGNNNTITGSGLCNSFINGDGNTLHDSGRTRVMASESEIQSGMFEPGTLLEAIGDVHVNTGTLYKWMDTYYTYYKGCVCGDYSAHGLPVENMSEADFIAGVEAKTLSENIAYTISNQTDALKCIPTFAIKHAGELLVASDDVLGCTTDFSANDYGIIGVRIMGNSNDVEEMVYYGHILGSGNKAFNRLPYAVQGDFIQGMNNTVSNGSNIICMGSCNTSTGHNSVAIGNQLISNKWQTVIGKYNKSLPGPERMAPGDTEAGKALFIIGNGYGDTENGNSYYGPTYKDESTIHRSNAMVVYADGTVEAKRFVATDEPDLAIVAGAGLEKTDDFNAGTTTISVDAELAKLLTALKARPKQAGKTYMLQSSGEDGDLDWVEVGMADAE